MTSYLKEKGVSDNMAENVRFLQLWDTYKGLLTERQQQVTDLFFNYDFSLSEIASETGVSRQSVSECINKCKKQLEEFETKLGLFEAIHQQSIQLSELLTKSQKWIDGMKEKHPELIEELSAFQGELFSEETIAD